MISNSISNVRRKQHGTGSKVTRVQLHSILSSLPCESSDDDTLILLGHTYQTPKKCAWCSALCDGYAMPSCKQLRQSVVAQLFGWQLMEQAKPFARRIAFF